MKILLIYYVIKNLQARVHFCLGKEETMLTNGYTVRVNDNNTKEYEEVITTPVVTFYKESGEQRIEIPIKYKGKTEQTINLCLNIKICEEEKKQGVSFIMVKDEPLDNVSKEYTVEYENIKQED